MAIHFTIVKENVRFVIGICYIENWNHVYIPIFNITNSNNQSNIHFDCSEMYWSWMNSKNMVSIFSIRWKSVSCDIGWIQHAWSINGILIIVTDVSIGWSQFTTNSICHVEQFIWWYQLLVNTSANDQWRTVILYQNGTKYEESRLLKISTLWSIPLKRRISLWRVFWKWSKWFYVCWVLNCVCRPLFAILSAFYMVQNSSDWAKYLVQYIAESTLIDGDPYLTYLPS